MPLVQVIMFLSKSDEETTSNRKLAKELVDKWVTDYLKMPSISNFILYILLILLFSPYFPESVEMQVFYVMRLLKCSFETIMSRVDQYLIRALDLRI